MHDDRNRSPGKPNRRLASITSSPLFIIVAESIVFFAPICQVGCARAPLTSARCHVFAGHAPKRAARRGQHNRLQRCAGLRRPDTERSHCVRYRPAGVARRFGAPPRRASSPAETISSLFAMATSIPRSTAAKTASNATEPSVAARTMSGSLSTATRSKPALPSPAVVASVTLNWRACSAQQFDVTPGRESRRLRTLVGMVRDDVERLRSDGAGGPENSDTFTHGFTEPARTAKRDATWQKT